MAFRRGAGSRYRGQGGHSLAMWADVLSSIGRADEAAAVVKLIAERDPQSEAATPEYAPTHRPRVLAVPTYTSTLS